MKFGQGKRLQFIYHGIVLDYLFKPGWWMSDEELLRLKRDLESVNLLANCPLQYGLFDPSRGSAQDIREFFKNTNACRMLDGDRAIGYFYNVELRHEVLKAIHAGLVVVGRNPGVDLLVLPYLLMMLLVFLEQGPFYMTGITAIPSVIGSFARVLSGVWPSHRASCARPPDKEYVRVVELLEEQYIRKYFPPGSTSVDKKRFVLSSPVEGMGFEPDMRKLARHPDLLANLFCQFWLDHSKGEDLIQVGKVGLAVALRNAFAFANHWLRGHLRVNRRGFVETAPGPASFSDEKRTLEPELRRQAV